MKQILSGSTNYSSILVMTFSRYSLKNLKKLAEFFSNFNPCPSLPSAIQNATIIFEIQLTRETRFTVLDRKWRDIA